MVTIDFLGDEYNFKPDGTVKDSQQVANHLMKEIKEISGNFNYRNSSKNKLAILLQAGLQITKNFLEMQDKYTDLEKNVEKRISSLTKKIDKGIEEETKKTSKTLFG